MFNYDGSLLTVFKFYQRYCHHFAMPACNNVYLVFNLGYHFVPSFFLWVFFFSHTLFTYNYITNKSKCFIYNTKYKVSRHARHIPPLLHTQGPIDERNTLTRVPPDPRERIIGSQLGWNIDRICREKERWQWQN